jgi:hypothetical protein
MINSQNDLLTTSNDSSSRSSISGCDVRNGTISLYIKQQDFLKSLVVILE